MESIEGRLMLSAAPLTFGQLAEAQLQTGTSATLTSISEQVNGVFNSGGGNIISIISTIQVSGISPIVTPIEPPSAGIRPVQMPIDSPTFIGIPTAIRMPSHPAIDPNLAEGGLTPLEFIGSDRRASEETAPGDRTALPPPHSNAAGTNRTVSSVTTNSSSEVVGELARELLIESDTFEADTSRRSASARHNSSSVTAVNQSAQTTIAAPAIGEFAMDSTSQGTPRLADLDLQAASSDDAAEFRRRDAVFAMDSELGELMPNLLTGVRTFDSKQVIPQSLPELLPVGKLYSPVRVNQTSDSPATSDSSWTGDESSQGYVFWDFASRNRILEVSGVLLLLSLERVVAHERRRRGAAILHPNAGLSPRTLTR